MNKNTKTQIVKSLNEELMQGLYIVLEPDAVDGHDETVSAEEVRKACHNFNRSHAVANLFHLVPTSGFEVVESYITPVDIEMGEQIVKAGTWLANLQFTETLWADVKAGKFSGVSIGAMGYREDIEE